MATLLVGSGSKECGSRTGRSRGSARPYDPTVLFGAVRSCMFLPKRPFEVSVKPPLY